MAKYLIFLVFLAGCGKIVDCSNLITVHNRSKVPDEVIKAGGEYWADVGVSFVLVEHDAKVVVKDLAPNPWWLGLTWTQTNEVDLVAEADKAVVAHEFGHILGLGHLKPTPVCNDGICVTDCDLMGPTYCPTDKLTDADILFFDEARYGCEPGIFVQLN